MAIVAGASALRIAASEASMVCSAKAYIPNGRALLTAPRNRTGFQSRATVRSPGPRTTTARSTAASPTRTKATTHGPRAGAATRMYRNEAPNIAPRKHRMRNCRAVITRDDATGPLRRTMDT
jgi:hypothetical protein